MPANSYGHMEMFRLSPRDGKALSRLNLFEGQILHGRIYRMEPYAQAGKGSTDSGGIAKIALGSYLIDAVVSRSIPQGAKVVLEVAKLADESFILKLISVEEPQTGGAKNQASMVKPDLIDLSPEALEKIGRAVPRIRAESLSTGQGKLVETPDLANVPPDAARVVRAAISQGFIEPANFTASAQTMRVVLHQAIEDLQAAISRIPSPSPEAGELVESIVTLISRIRPMVASLPASGISAGDDIGQIATALRDIATALRPVIESSGDTSAQTATAKGDQTGTTESSRAQSQSSERGAAPDTGGKAGTVADPQAPGTVKPTTGQSQQPRTPAPLQPTIPGTASSDQATGKPIDPAFSGLLSGETGLSGESSADAASPAGETAHSGDSARAVRAHPARNLLVALRVLSSLAERLAETRGWTVEQSNELRNHAARISSTTDALEGTIIAPLLTHSPDVADFIPRILISFLFTGGHADLAVMQPDEKSGGEGRDTEEKSSESNRTIGVMRLRTEALGRMRVHLDYAETNGDSRVGGRFIVAEETADALKRSISELDRSLDARGLKSEGFRIVGMKSGNDNTDKFTGNAGGIDLKV